MKKSSSWLKGLFCHKNHHKFQKSIDSNNVDCDKRSNSNNIKPLEQDGSVKETLSLSTTSQTPGLGDGGSASLGDWSAVHQVDCIDNSKVNLLCDGSHNSASAIISFLNRAEFCDRLESIIARLEKVAQLGLEKTPGLVAFESLMAGSLKNYLTCSKKLGGNIQSQSSCVYEAFCFVRDLIQDSMVYRKPNETEMDILLKKLDFKLIEIANFSVEALSVRKYQLSTVADSMLILNWVENSSASQYVKEMKDSAWLYANKVVQYCRKSLPEHVEWIRSWLACLEELCLLVDEHFPYGLKWNSNGPKLPLPTVEIRPVQRLQPNCNPTLPCRTSSAENRRAKMSMPSQSTSPDLAQLFSELTSAHKNLRHVSVPDIL
ncbi:unnamed protein product [Trichobilharzia szidati]|nr:unnamed protein product [Trichobilharzia szidati]